VKSKFSTALCLLVLTVSAASAQAPAVLNPNAPKPGTPAPALTFTQVLQAPAGTKVDWPSLRGKAVVLEFWATWCVPCLAEIPVLNSLVASVDPAKVQIISVDDEDPAVVEDFLKKKPISGWIGIDTSGELYKRFGVNARPATMVIDPQGRVVNTTVRPEQLKSDQLLALADGRPVTLGGKVDPKVQAELDAATEKALSDQTGKKADSAQTLFEITLSRAEPSKDGKRQNQHIMLLGPEIDITNAPPATLLSYGAGVAPTRITTRGALPDAQYNLHVEAPGADPKLLGQAIELAIASGAGLHIEHQTALTDAYILTAKPEAKDHLTQSPYPGIARFNPQTQTLQCLNASLDQLASALEKALGTPVVNETGLSGMLMLNLKIAPKDLSSANDALKGIGLGLSPAKRPIETVILSAAPAAGKESAPSATAAKPHPE
jgi:uncharacterized protein (TIGR03435 family)